MKKQRRVQRPTFSFRKVQFLNAEILTASQDTALFVDIHTVCTALRLAPSSQLLRLTKNNKTLHKVNPYGKVARLLSAEDTQWWLDTLTDELLNTYAGRLISEYRKALIPDLKKAHFSPLPMTIKASARKWEVVKSDNVGPLSLGSTPQITTDFEDEGTLAIYKRMEENSKLRDQAALRLKEAELEMQRYQGLIDKDLAKVNDRLSPGCRFYPSLPRKMMEKEI